MNSSLDADAPIFVRALNKLIKYPKELRVAFEMLFSEGDLCVYHHGASERDIDVVFYFFVPQSNLFYKYTLIDNDLLFFDDDEGAEQILDRLVDVEESFTRIQMRELIHFMQYRLAGVPELEALKRFTNFLDGIDNYSGKAKSNETQARLT